MTEPEPSRGAFSSRRERHAFESIATAHRRSPRNRNRSVRGRATLIAPLIRVREAPKPSRLRNPWAKLLVVVAASGLIGTTALPAYATTADEAATVSRARIAVQTLLGGGAATPAATRDDVAIAEDTTKLDSTLEPTVSPTVQRLAQTLMAAVAQGRLTGYTPNHIPEIANLADGRVVRGFGIDYRVLQTIQVALATFNSVGVSDINRRCTGQIEGAGSASSHYADGGGHAVDFYLLNGRPLTGGDPESVKLIRALDSVMPADTNLGQVGCRASIAVSNFIPFDDTCDHLHIDFRQAKGTTLRVSEFASS